MKEKNNCVTVPEKRHSIVVSMEISRKLHLSNKCSLPEVQKELTINKLFSDSTQKLELAKTISLLNYAKQFNAIFEEIYYNGKQLIFTLEFKDAEYLEVFKDTILPKVLHSTK